MTKKVDMIYKDDALAMVMMMMIVMVMVNNDYVDDNDVNYGDDNNDRDDGTEIKKEGRGNTDNKHMHSCIHTRHQVWHVE